MIARVGAHIRKELLLLHRDRAGLALLFLMPVCLVVIMAVVQDAPFRDFSDRQLNVLYDDKDGGTVGERVRAGLERTGSFTITDGKGMADGAFRDAVRQGRYQVGIVIPAGASLVLDARAEGTITSVFGPLTGDRKDSWCAKHCAGSSAASVQSACWTRCAPSLNRSPATAWKCPR